MTEERHEHHELSSAGVRRRERMLPLLQDAVRDRVRRRRQRRAVACSLLALLVTFGLVELFEESGPVRNVVDTRLADGFGEVVPEPIWSVESTVAGSLDLGSYDSKAMYERTLARNPDFFITTPDRLPDSARTPEVTVVVDHVSTEQLMIELAMAGMDSAVICSERGCTLFTAGGSVRDADEEPDAPDALERGI